MNHTPNQQPHKLIVHALFLFHPFSLRFSFPPSPPFFFHRSFELRHHRPPPHRKRHPSPDQTQPAQRRDGAHDLPPLRIQHEEIQAAAEQSHPGGEERHGERVLRGGDRGDRQGDRVHELLCGGGRSVEYSGLVGVVVVVG